MSLSQLTTEQRFVVERSHARSQAPPSTVKRDELEQISWPAVADIAAAQKILPLLWWQVRQRNEQELFPPHWQIVLQQFSVAVDSRNQSMFDMTQTVVDALRSRHVNVAPTKGCVLNKDTYPRFGGRWMDDTDLLVHRHDLPIVERTLSDIGYTAGTWDPERNTIKALPREKDLLWRARMHNLPPYGKLTSDPLLPVHIVDVSWSVDLDRDSQIVDGFLNRSSDGRLTPEDLLVHLCIHNYREASGPIWIALARDSNLAKLCDIREMILGNVGIDGVISMIERLPCTATDALFFNIICLGGVYNDGYEEEILRRYRVDAAVRHQLVGSFGDPYTGRADFQSCFLERLFRHSNRRELAPLRDFVQRQDRFNEL